MQRGNPERTLYVVAYDIGDDRRRNRVHKALCSFGKWTQYSVFECHLSERELIAMREKAMRLLKPEEDSLRIYPLCKACREKVETIGSDKPSEERVWIV